MTSYYDVFGFAMIRNTLHRRIFPALCALVFGLLPSLILVEDSHASQNRLIISVETKNWYGKEISGDFRISAHWEDKDIVPRKYDEKFSVEISVDDEGNSIEILSSESIFILNIAISIDDNDYEYIFPTMVLSTTFDNIINNFGNINIRLIGFPATQSGFSYAENFLWSHSGVNPANLDLTDFLETMQRLQFSYYDLVNNHRLGSSFYQYTTKDMVTLHRYLTVLSKIKSLQSKGQSFILVPEDNEVENVAAHYKKYKDRSFSGYGISDEDKEEAYDNGRAVWNQIYQDALEKIYNTNFSNCELIRDWLSYILISRERFSSVLMPEDGNLRRSRVSRNIGQCSEIALLAN